MTSKSQIMRHKLEHGRSVLEKMMKESEAAMTQLEIITHELNKFKTRSASLSSVVLRR